MPDEFIAQGTMTVTEFLSFYAKFRKIPSKRVIEVIQILGLEEKKHECIKHLSKGMRERLFIRSSLDRVPSGHDP